MRHRTYGGVRGRSREAPPTRSDPKLLDLLDLKGHTITIDAIGT